MGKSFTSSGTWLYVISDVNNSQAFENFFKAIRPSNNDIHILFLYPYAPELQIKCDQLGYKTKWIKYNSKKSIPKVFLKVCYQIIQLRPKLIHNHLFDASLIGLFASWILKVKIRIHTRHHASMHHEYFPHVVKYDNMINIFSTKIIAVSENIRTILIEKENVQSKKIKVIYHGFDLSNFNNVNSTRIIELQKKYNIEKNAFVVVMISRYTHWKGIQYVIPAFKKLLMEFPHSVLVLANASGDYTTEIKSLLKNLPVESYREISFEKDSPSLFKMFNVFVHVPIDDHSEAFGQVYVEALAAKCPTIFTISGIAKEFIIPDKNSTVVPFCNSEAIYFALRNQIIDPAKTESLVLNGFNDVHKHFAIEMMIDKTLECYAN